MTLILRAGLTAVSSIGLCLMAVLAPAEDDQAAPDIGIVHAADGEAWVDLERDLASTWDIVRRTLAERGHPVASDVSYVESNGQIAIEGLWVAVVPRASLGIAITRVRMVALPAEADSEGQTELLVRAGVLLGVIAERAAIANSAAALTASPAAGPSESVPVAVPGSEYEYEAYDTYNVYNTYNTYDYGPSTLGSPVYVYPSYVWRPWWWLGYGPGCGWYGSYGWSNGWSWGLSWGSGPYWPASYSFCGWGPSWYYGASWCYGSAWWDDDCDTTIVVTNNNDNTVVVDTGTGGRDTGRNVPPATTPTGFDSRAGGLSSSDPALLPDSGGRGRTASAAGSRTSSTPAVGPTADRGLPVPRSPSRSSSTLSTSDGLGAGAVASLPLIQPVGDARGRDARNTNSSSDGRSRSSGSIQVTRNSTASVSRAGSVTRMKGLTLTPVYGAIHDAGAGGGGSSRANSSSGSSTTRTAYGRSSKSALAESNTPAVAISQPTAPSSSSSNPFALRPSPSSGSSLRSSPSFGSISRSTPTPSLIPRTSAPAPRSTPAPSSPAPRVGASPSRPSTPSFSPGRSSFSGASKSSGSPGHSSGQSSGRSAGRSPR
jgi:hypothetical protein